jgi:hypothetical protein
MWPAGRMLPPHGLRSYLIPSINCKMLVKLTTCLKALVAFRTLTSLLDSLGLVVKFSLNRVMQTTIVASPFQNVVSCIISKCGASRLRCPFCAFLHSQNLRPYYLKHFGCYCPHGEYVHKYHPSKCDVSKPRRRRIV